MAEEILNDPLPDLKELENKVGRKTPESLLVWMRDAADSEDGWRSDVVDREQRSFSAFSDSFSDKISNLKQEMRWLRSADVRILRQLVAVHEGIEAMRWLAEERDTLASRDSSLTGSLSSLVTEEPGPSMSPCRENQSPTQDLAETTGEESEDHPPHTDHYESNHKSFFDRVLDSAEAGPPDASTSKFGVTRSTHGSHGKASSSLARDLVSANFPMSQPLDSDVGQLEDIKRGGDTIRRALLRSSRVRKEVWVDDGSFALTKQSEEKQAEHQPQQPFRASQNNMKKKEESAPNTETILLGYDAQWCWVESQDDVTFL